MRDRLRQPYALSHAFAVRADFSICRRQKIDAFERMIRPHGLIEMARTGEVAISRSRPDS